MAKKDILKDLGAYGANVLRKGSDTKRPDIIPTGIPSLDILTGGGWPRGRALEYFGPEGSGKSTLALLAIAEAQKMGLACVYIDLERTYDPLYSALLGVDNEMIIAPTFDDGESAIDAAIMMADRWDEVADKTGLPSELGIMVIDSVAALLPRAEKDAEMGDSHVGLMGRMTSKACRILTPLLHDRNVTILYINQLRGTINSGPFAPKTGTTGGNAIKYYASSRVDVRRIGQIKCKDAVVGAKIKIMLKKDKISGNESKHTTVDMFHGKGFSIIGDLIDLSIEKGLTKKGGAWYTYKEQRFQGAENMKIWLKDNPNELEELRLSIVGGGE